MSVFIELVAKSLIENAGPFSHSEFDNAWESALCAARSLIKGEITPSVAVQQVKQTAGTDVCACGFVASCIVDEVPDYHI